ncbi:hypothetical protein Sjap_012305 [Stephania japonica]|uniref:Outer envelope pore protein 16, chloroplastic n=1 Tax=Stephania japonica TaxID=461633 RepID=A0AAP0IXH2_9MAGN
MPRSRFAGSLSSPKIDVVIDMGNPFLNVTVDGFLKIGSVAATKVAAEETYHCIRKAEEDVPGGRLLGLKMEMKAQLCYLFPGAVAGVYVGSEYGIERIRGTRDWKNAMLGGALTGAIVSAASSSDKNKIIMDAITGGAVATAEEFINYLT